jgi:hypothetical protein
MSREPEFYRSEQRRRQRRKLRARSLFKKIAPKLGLAIYRRRDNFHYCPEIYGAGYWKKIDIRDWRDHAGG